MQAVILAAGFGSRLGKITNGKPKSFLQINNETLIERAVRLLHERGISDVHVVTGYKNELMEDKLKGKAVCHHNPLYFCTNVLASFSVAMTALRDDFIFLHADTIFETSILDQLLAAKGDMVLPIDFKKVQEEEMKVRVDQHQNIVEISKEIPLELAHGEFMGLAKISQGVLDEVRNAVIEELQSKKLLQSYFEGAIQNMIDKGATISSLDISDKSWIEIDFEEDYHKAVELFNFEVTA